MAHKTNEITADELAAIGIECDGKGGIRFDPHRVELSKDAVGNIVCKVKPRCFVCKVVLDWHSNCQPENIYQVHLKGRGVDYKPATYFNGCGDSRYGCEVRLCDQCRGGLFTYLGVENKAMSELDEELSR